MSLVSPGKHDRPPTPLNDLKQRRVCFPFSRGMVFPRQRLGRRRLVPCPLRCVIQTEPLRPVCCLTSRVGWKIKDEKQQNTCVRIVCLLFFSAAHQRRWSAAPPSRPPPRPPPPLLGSPPAPRPPAPPPSLPVWHRPEAKSAPPRGPCPAPPGPLGPRLLPGLWTGSRARCSARPRPRQWTSWSPAALCGTGGTGRARTACGPGKSRKQV